MRDSEKLINFIFGSEIYIHTRREKEFILHTFKAKDNIRIIDKDQIEIESDNLQILPHEEPDLILINHKNVYAIEHFEVDSSKRNRNGSKYQQRYNSKHFSEGEKLIDDRLMTEKMVVSTEKVETNLCYKNLLENTINSFNAHYMKIDSYRNNITKYEKLKTGEIKFIFYIEYNIVFPSFFIIENGPMIPVYPHNDIAFINYLRKKEKIVGIIFHYYSRALNIPNVNQFILITEKNLFEYNVNNSFVFDLSKKEVHDFEQPMMSSVAFIVPDKT